MNTKEKIKESALQLFLTKGYAVGVNEIIKKAGTSKGAFYHHFSSKGQLFIDTIDKFFFGFMNEIEEINGARLNFREKIALLVKNTYAPFKSLNYLIQEREQLNYLSIMAEYPNHENLRVKRISYFSRFIESFSKIIETAKDEGKIMSKVDAGTLSFQLLMLIDGSIFNAILMYNSVDKAEEACLLAVNQMLDMVEQD